MKKTIFLLLFGLFLLNLSGQNKNVKTIHVFVALCDNVNQGIVPVSKSLGNGMLMMVNILNKRLLIF